MSATLALTEVGCRRVSSTPGQDGELSTLHSLLTTWSYWLRLALLASLTELTERTVRVGCWWVQSVRLWNATDMQCRHVLRDHEDKVTAAVWSSSGALLATASLDQKALLYRVPPDGNHPKLVATLQVRGGSPCITVLAKDGQIQRADFEMLWNIEIAVVPSFSRSQHLDRASYRPTHCEDANTCSFLTGIETELVSCGSIPSSEIREGVIAESVGSPPRWLHVCDRAMRGA